MAKGKLGNIFEGNTFRITQGLHGKKQNDQSVDCTGGHRSLKLIAPAKGDVERVYGGGGHKGFHFVDHNWDILFHHARPVRTGRFKKGEVIGYADVYSPAHLHTSIKVDGKWRPILEFMDRNIRITTEWAGQNHKLAKWSTWEDRYLILDDTTMTKNDLRGMRDILSAIKGRFVKNESKLKEWLEVASSKSPWTWIHELAIESKFDAKRDVRGEEDCKQYKARINELESEMDTLNKEISTLEGVHANCEQEVVELREKVDVLEIDNEALIDDLQDARKDRDEWRTSFEEVKQENGTLKNQVKQLDQYRDSLFFKLFQWLNQSK